MEGKCFIIEHIVIWIRINLFLNTFTSEGGGTEKYSLFLRKSWNCVV